MELYGFQRTILAGAVALLVGWPPPASAAGGGDLQVAARAGPEDPATESIVKGRPDPLVRRIQKALAAARLYRGPIDGRFGPATEAAVRAYQRRTGLEVDGVVSEALAARLEAGAKVGLLLKRLQRVRDANMDAARRALLSRPETRDLLEPGKEAEVADPTRDATSCFRAPTVRCLLAEASESAKAIFKPAMRDWALGELLVAQARAGLIEEARLTVRRIRDPRLIMVALRDIARAQAMAGRNREALLAAEVIPDPAKQVEAYAAIAEIQAEQGDGAGARETVKRLLWTLRRERETLKRVAFRTRAAVILHRAGDPRGAAANLEAAEAMARAEITGDERGSALRHVAAALADMERPQRALAVLEEVTGESDRTPVQVAAATVQARTGDAAEALATAESIEVLRYRAVVLGRIAVAQAEAGHEAEARASVERALAATAAIKLPYARAYAISRAALALVEIGRTNDGAAEGGDFNRAVETALKIEDDRLRAHVLWSIAAERRRSGDGAGAVRTEELADKASREIKSRLSQVWMFGDIALGHAEAGETEAAWAAFGRAKEIAEGIRNAWGRTRTLGKLATTLIELFGAEPPSAAPAGSTAQ